MSFSKPRITARNSYNITVIFLLRYIYTLSLEFRQLKLFRIHVTTVNFGKISKNCWKLQWIAVREIRSMSRLSFIRSLPASPSHWFKGPNLNYEVKTNVQKCISFTMDVIEYLKIYV